MQKKSIGGADCYAAVSFCDAKYTHSMNYNVTVSTALDAFAHATYFTLRSGGQVLITILFDSVFMWVVAIPTARLLADLTKIGIKLLFPICHGLEAVKAFLGLALVSRKTWVKQLVSQSDKQEKR